MVKHGEETQLKDISWLDKIGYGSGNLGFGIVYQIIGAYLVFYATAVLDIPGSLIGIAVSAGVVWDGITDPLMGYFSDITHHRLFGRRHIYILIGSIGIFAANSLLWIVDPLLPTYNKFMWILVDLIIIKSFMTVYATPYTALGAELSSDYNERTTIQGIKMIFFLLGLFLASVMGMFIFFKPTAQFPVGQLNPRAYVYMGLTASVLMLAFGLFCFFTTKKYIPYLPKPINRFKKQSSRAYMRICLSFVDAFKNKNYKYVVFGYLFTNIASALASTLGLHVFTYTFNLGNKSIAFIVGTQFLMSILSQPAWVYISRKIDKKPSVILGLTLAIIGCGAFLVLMPFRDFVVGNFLYLLPYAALVGFGTGGLFSIPISMIADTIDLEELNTGVRSEGIYYGCLTLSYKLSQSIAIFMLGILLDVVRFDSSLPVQPESTVKILGVILPLGSAIVFIMAILSYIKYDLNKDKVLDIQEQIKIRKEEGI